VSKASIIEDKLTAKPLDSKKAIYALCGASCVLFVFIGSSLLILTHAEASKDIVELASLTIMFFGAIITTLITGTAVMDWKAVSALQHMSEDVKVDSNAEAPDMVVNQSIQKSRWHDDGVL
jgi:uncharacterized membrane protein